MSPKTPRKTGQKSATVLTEQYLNQAIEVGSSDIHVEPDSEYLRFRFRIDGLLREVGREALAIHESLISRLKVLAKLDISESRRPQDGRFPITKEGRKYEIRLSIFPTSYGECAVLRVLDRSSILYSFEGLGMNKEQQKAFGDITKKKYGLVLVTGPTSSGKTTTLFSALNTINSVDKCICTLEDPVEYRLPLLRQTQVDPDRGLGFDTGLHSLFRQNPDVIMVGEIRDRATGRIAIEAAMTGHLVFTTLHTNDAPGAVIRLLNMDIESFMISSSLLGCIAQRLVRKVCTNCQESYKPPSNLIKGLDLKANHNFRRGKGCDQCSFTGYQGRTGIYEIFTTNDEMEQLIISRPNLNQMRKLAVSQGMETLRQSGIKKAIQGLTTLEEVFRVTQTN